MDNKEITEAVSRRRLALGNAQADPLVLDALAPYGYDAAKLAAGLEMVDQLETLSHAQATEYGEQMGATQALNAVLTVIQRKYSNAIAIARIELGDDAAAIAALRLSGRRERSLAGWLNQATAFYKGLLAHPAWLAALAGYDEGRVQAELAQVEQVAELDRQQEKETGEAHAATKARDAQFDACNEWWNRYVAYARVALEDQPDKLKLVTEGEI